MAARPSFRLLRFKPQTLQDTVCQRQPGFLSIASGLVSCDEQYRAVIENALGRTVICDTLDNAVRMARACGSRVRIVTLDGQVMNAGGSMTGGSAAKSAGVLTRANTLAKLAEERKALTESAETLKAQTAEAASAAAKTEFELTAVRGQLREAEDEVLRRTEEHKQVQLLAAAVTENLENIEKELAHLTSRTGGEEGKLQTLKAQLQQQTSAQEALRATGDGTDRVDRLPSPSSSSSLPTKSLPFVWMRRLSKQRALLPRTPLPSFRRSARRCRAT